MKTEKKKLAWYLVTDTEGSILIQANSYTHVYDLVKTPLKITEVTGPQALMAGIQGAKLADIDLTPAGQKRRLWNSN